MKNQRTGIREELPSSFFTVIQAGLSCGEMYVLPHMAYVQVIPSLVDAGYEVFSIDWLGHGLSDKPLDGALISFELHMHTLIEFFNHYQLQGSYIVAHDWGGYTHLITKLTRRCIALCTIPYLSEWQISGLVLFNSFFPPRPTEITLKTYALYLIWFFCTGIFNGYLPEAGVMKYMSPTASYQTTRGYSAPFSSPKLKASVTRFAHIVPGLPDFMLEGARGWYAWKIMEGLFGATRFSNLNMQARLARRGQSVREYWSNNDKCTGN